jgi:hypothetical protein
MLQILIVSTAQEHRVITYRVNISAHTNLERIKMNGSINGMEWNAKRVASINTPEQSGGIKVRTKHAADLLKPKK